jgi:hypothetical protein
VPGAENLDNSDTLALAARLPDQPFSARYRVDGTTLTIKDVKFGGVGLNDMKNNDMAELLLVVGRYKKKSGAGEETPW